MNLQSKIIAYGKLPTTYHTMKGDKFSLIIEGEVVHTVDITEGRAICCWAYVEGTNHCGYIIGDETFAKELGI